MVKSITVTNELNESLNLILASPEKSGFVVRGVEGLGPPKANINSTELATSDGSLYNSARASSRNVILYLNFLWDPTIELVRQKSYKYFPIKQRVKLTIETDERTTEVYGYVESNENNIFSSSEGCQISIMCPKAYVQSAETTITVLSGIESLFEFPFSNESLTEDLIIFGEIQNNTGQNIHYTGDADVGVLFTVSARGTATNLSIYNSATREIMKIDTDKLQTLTGDVIILGDVITISTVKGEKYASLLRDGIVTNIINCIDRASSWIQLVRGDNVFAYIADTGSSVIDITIENKTIYEGV